MATRLVNALPPLQTSAAAWLGPAMAAAPSRWTWAMRESEVREVEAAADAFLESDLPVAALATPGNFALPTLAPRLRALRQELIHGRGFELVRGLPLHEWSAEKAAAAFVGIGAQIGSLRSQNKQGHLLGTVADIGAASDDPSVRIYQTAERQTFHVDSCDVVALACIYPAQSGGNSLLSSALSAWNALHARMPALAAALLDPVAIDRRGEVPRGMDPWFISAPLVWHDKLLGVGAGYQRQYIDSAQRHAGAPRLSALQTDALDAFDALLDDPSLRLEMRLASGDLQFVYNHTLLHDRTAFVDSVDGEEERRKLYRLWLSPVDDRSLPDAFADRFGSTAVGDRGGILCPGTEPTLGL